MFHTYLRHNRLILATMGILCAGFLGGCASIGTPGGGLYDETPPVPKTSKPLEGGLNVNNQKITIHFDENIKLNNVMDKLTISPPQEKAPTVLSNAKTVTVELLDSLKSNTTYTLDFGDAIQDNNEGNTLDHFALTFSTGDKIDSLRISGTLLNAADLEPITGAYVGIYPDSLSINDSTIVDADSAFQIVPMTRASKTNAFGQFKITGIAPGRYRLYALKDGNTNYRYDLFTENIAFYDSIIVPDVKETIQNDTVWADSTTIDSIRTMRTTVYSPKKLLLYMFNEGKTNLYLDNDERPDSVRLTFRFSGPMPSAPSLNVVSFNYKASADSLLSIKDSLSFTDWYITESNPTNDTITYWIKDSLLYKADTLSTAISYLYTDTNKVNVLRTDTLTFIKPLVKEVKESKSNGGLSSLKNKLFNRDNKDKRKSEQQENSEQHESEDAASTDSLPKITYMKISCLTGNTFDIGQKPVFEVSQPLASYDTAMMHLEYKSDSLWIPLKYKWIPDSTHIRRYTLYALPHYDPGVSYRLVIDSLAMYNIYGQPIATTTLDFRERTREEYAHLLFRISGIDEPAIVQLINEKDVVTQQANVIDKKAKFVNVLPGKYYARILIDKNGNGVFDAGNLAARQQPEQIYYFNNELQLRANWEVSQEWNPTSLDVRKQKPDAVKINKPKEEKEKVSKNAEYYAKQGITPPTPQTKTIHSNDEDY